MGSIHLNLRSTRVWQTDAMCQALVKQLVDCGEFWLPEKFDDHEPERNKFDPDNTAKLEKMWMSQVGSVIFKRRKPRLSWMTFNLIGSLLRRPNDVQGGIDQRYIEGPQNTQVLLDGLKRLYDWGSIAHGFACHEDDWNEKNYFGRPTRVAGGKMMSTGGLFLEEGLPGIYWANFFGPAIVDFLGAERFETVPAHHKERLADGGWLLLSAADPLAFADPATRELEAKMVAHLGADAFFDKRHPERACRAPKLDVEPVVTDAHTRVTSADFDPLAEVIPNLEEFLRDVPELAAALANRLGAKADYSSQSLDDLDSFILKRSYRRPEPWTKPAGRSLLRELTAYYGEVVRRALNGSWTVDPTSGQPAISYGKQELEFPFLRVTRLWCERESSDRLAFNFPTLASGELNTVRSFLKSLGVGPR